MQKKFNNFLLYIVSGAFISATVSIILWSFLKFMSVFMNLIWTYIPSVFNIPLYTLIVCIIGGIIIGFLQKKLGQYPDELEYVLMKVKTNKWYNYHNMFIILLCALLPLIFGSSVGPEAGLTGVIVGLCYWMKDYFYYTHNVVNQQNKESLLISCKNIIKVSFLSLISAPKQEICKQNDNKNIKREKTLFYALVIVLVTIILSIMFKYLGGGLVFPRFSEATYGKNELIFFIPLVIIGIVFGYLYYLIDKLSITILKPLKNKPWLKAVIGAVVFGIIAMFIPMTMFSGEEQIGEMIEKYQSYAIYALLMIAIVKLFTTTLCINSGLKGGKFFPAIFAGVTLGYAISLMIPVDPIVCVMAVTATEIGMLLRRPLITTIILLICFPINGIFVIALSALAGSFVPIPKLLKNK